MSTDSRLRRRLVGLLFAAAIALLVSGMTTAFMLSSRNHSQPTADRIGGAFTLTTQSGGKLSDTDLKGTPFGIFFGFTHCQEICPTTTLWEMSEALEQLGPDAGFKVLFVSVDPTRDTPEFHANYLQSFDPRIVGLTGSEAEIAEVGRKYRAFWEKVPLEGGDYTMNHTASVYLMDGAGEFVGLIAYGEKMETRMEKLRKLTSGADA